MNDTAKKLLPVSIVAIVAVAAFSIWSSMQASGPGPGFARGNGRIEATEIAISAKLAGRIEKIMVQEGDFVKVGQVLVQMQVDTLQAQLGEAKAQYHQAVSDQLRAQAQVTLKESDKMTAEAVVLQRASELDATQRRLARSSVLSKKGAMAIQDFDDDETSMHGAKAALVSARAQVTVADAAIRAAEAEAKGAQAKIEAALSIIARIETDIKDSSLTAPRSGRIQYRISQEGEVLAAGGKVLNLVDLADAYMTFFLPGAEAGRLFLGQEASIILDAAPHYPIPASISFVASTAQFTPKTVETETERQKLMFRVKAQIDPEILREHIQYVKTGVSGVTWVKVDPAAAWPESLMARKRQ